MNNLQPYVVDDDKKKKKKKKKKKDDDDDAEEAEVMEVVEMTSSSSKKNKKPKSTRKPKSTKGPKSERKKSSKKKSSSTAETKYDDKVTAYPVLEASGWEPLLISEINEEHTKTAAAAAGFGYAITGHESQIVTVAIPPGEMCKGEPGSMMYLGPNLEFKLTCEENCFGRCCSGESCCALTFKNTASTTGYAGLVTNDPLAKVVPVELSSPSVGGSLIVQGGAYMAHYGQVRIGMDCDCNIVRCCCGGMGLVRQKITGTGTAFLGATGTIVQKVLKDGETMLMDNNCILAYAESCKFDVARTGGIVGMIGGGEGIFNASITGPGLCVVQSMNMVVLLESLAAEKIYRR